MIVSSPLLLSGPVVRPTGPESTSSTLGKRADSVKTTPDSAAYIQIEVRGVKGAPSGSYKLAYSSGAPLKYYLDILNLKNVAAKSAVYDYSNLEKGRCRMHYVPSPDSRIVLGPASYGPAFEWQRCNHDVRALMNNMGDGASIVERPV
jgi:hypothetical protein